MLSNFVCKGLGQIWQHYQVGNERAAFKRQGQKYAQTEDYQCFKSITVCVISKVSVCVCVCVCVWRKTGGVCVHVCVCVCLEEGPVGVL